MDDENIQKQSSDSVISSRVPQTKCLSPRFSKGTVSNRREKLNITLDLRYPRLAHLFIAENAIWKNQNNSDEVAEDQILSQHEGLLPSGGYSRPQTARRGRRFHQLGSRCYPKTRIVQENDELVPSSQDYFSDTAPDDFYSVAAISQLHRPMELREHESNDNLNSEAYHESMINSGKDQSSVFGFSVLDLIDELEQNGTNTTEAIGTEADRYNQASTIIHLKMAAPTDSKVEDVSGNSRVLTPERSRVVGKSTSPNAACESEKRKRDMIKDDRRSSENNSIDSDDEEIPLIMHCKRKDRSPADGIDYCETTMRQEVKRTYQRGSMMQHLSGATSNQSEDQPGTEKPASEKFYARGSYGAAKSTIECRNESKRNFKSKNAACSDVHHRQRMLLEAYERNNQVLKNTGETKETAVKKHKYTAKSSSGDETSKRTNLRKSTNQSTLNTFRNHLIGRLIPGPVSVKRAQMKRLRFNPRLISRVLRRLTERKCPSDRTVATFDCMAHQNYYDGCLVHRLTKRPPPRERVTVHVPAGSLEDLDQVGREIMRLWKLGVDEVEELKKQVKQEMKHKRTEHIMPVLLQMSFEQIESAYEQVKKDMTTYEVTEDDEEEEEEEKDGDEEEEIEESENVFYGGKASDDKGVEENLLEQMENDTDENLHLASYEIIVHDESSKTVSCETVKYLEWREKHPTPNNGALEMQPSVQNTSEANSDDKVGKASKILETVKPNEETVKQTVYSQNRPKRHAVDYSPSAFAPIRLMEGKRLGGTRETPLKHFAKKSTGEKAKTVTPTGRQEKQISVSASVASSKASRHFSTVPETLHHAHTNGSESNISSSAGTKNEIKDNRRLPVQLKSPQSPSELVMAPVGNVSNATDECLAHSKGVVDDCDGDNFLANTASDDDMPVILDVSEMTMSLETDSSSYARTFSRDFIGANEPESTLSTYDAVRNEYFRLRGLTETDVAVNAFSSDDIQRNSGTCNACDNAPNALDNECNEHLKATLNSNLTSQENLTGNFYGGMVSDSLVEGSGIRDGKDGETWIHMPNLRLPCSDSCDLEAENPLAPPDLGLPIEYSNIRQRSVSPVQPPVLLEEEMSCDKGSNSVKTSLASVDFVNDSGACL